MIAIGAANIHHSFSNKPILRGITFDLHVGSLTGLIGPSGVGKSVLLKILSGVMQPTSGSIHMNGTMNDTVQAESLDQDSGCKAISLMFQEGALFDSLSVFDNVAFPLVNGRVPAMILPREELDRVYDQVNEILRRVGLEKASQKMPAQLSGGMRRRASLARALVARPKILLLDDPTSGLDPIASGVIMNLICELHREYKPTTLVVSQDLRRLIPSVAELMALFDGKIVFRGKTTDLLTAADREVRYFVSCRFDLTAPVALQPIHF